MKVSTAATVAAVRSSAGAKQNDHHVPADPGHVRFCRQCRFCPGFRRRRRRRRFLYHRSEQTLLAAFEYVTEAACIIDRSGTAYRLALDSNRHLILGPPLGPVKFHWLRHAWRTHKTPTRRGTGFAGSTPSAGTKWSRTCWKPSPWNADAPAEGAWALDIGGLATHPSRWRTSIAGLPAGRRWSTSM